MKTGEMKPDNLILVRKLATCHIAFSQRRFSISDAIPCHLRRTPSGTVPCVPPQLRQWGFCVIPNVIPQPALAQVATEVSKFQGSAKQYYQ